MGRWEHVIGPVLLALLALIWAGMVIGVSGLATPVKFSAPSLSLPVALDVGRVTFRLFSRVEWGLTAALVLLGLAAGTSLQRIAIALVAAVVVLQGVWLLPLLDARISAIIAGEIPPASPHHRWFIALEAVKLALLVAAGLGAIRRAGRAA